MDSVVAGEEDAQGGADDIESRTECSTNFDGYPGDTEFYQEGNVPMTIKPNFDNNTFENTHQDGSWSDDEEEPSRNGNFGVLCGNWGGLRKSRSTNEHMAFDLKSGPCNILLLSESDRETLQCLREAVKPREDEEDNSCGDGQKQRRTSQYLGLRGVEASKTVMICARKSLVKGMRLRLFRLILNGQYNAGKKEHKKTYVAKSRILVVTLKMRFFRFDVDDENGTPKIHGGGARMDELTVMSVHLHYMCAKKAVKEGAQALKEFWDELADHIMEYQVRIFGGDFNMALFCVIPEMRARGILVNVAAWFPWKWMPVGSTKIDSMGIFIVGPCQGCRKIFDASSILPSAVVSHAVGASWEVMYKSRGGGRSEKPANQRHELACSERRGAGFTIESYQPKNADRRKQFIEWTLDPVIGLESLSMQGPLLSGRNDRAAFPFAPRSGKGMPTLNWAMLPPCQQKCCEMEKFDPDEELWDAGAHFPTMIFVGYRNQSRRSSSAVKRRQEKADKRGWTADRRHQKGSGRGNGKNNNSVVTGANSVVTGASSSKGGGARWSEATSSNGGGVWTPPVTGASSSKWGSAPWSDATSRRPKWQAK